ncbi:unnamed protein product [Sympodiomycopsis kandeliae]
MSSYQYWQLPKPAERKDFNNLTLQNGSTSSLKPKRHEVVVKVHAVSLNYRDLIIAKNQYPLALKDDAVIPVSDGAGVVEAIGEDVDDWKAGDRVVGIFTADHLYGAVAEEKLEKSAFGGPIDGWLAQYVAVPAHALVSIPKHMSFEEAATLPCAAVTAWNGLYGLPSSAIRSGQWLLAEGTGGVSVLAVQIAIAAGANAIITSSSDEKLAKVKTSIPEHSRHLFHGINYKKVPNWGQEAYKLANGEGVDHVIEVGGPGTLEGAFAALKKGGHVSNIGFVAGGEQPNMPLNVLAKRAIYRGIFVGSRELFRDLNAVYETHQLHPLIDKVFDFKDAVKAYEYQWSAAHVGKVVIKIA